MWTKRTSAWRTYLALLPLLLLSMCSAVSAQTTQTGGTILRDALMPGMTVWITDSSGREQQTRILSVSSDVVTTMDGGEVRYIRPADITLIRARHSDSVINGALIGAGAAIAAGLFMCTRTEPWENCRDDVGPIVRIGAIGAGIGVGIDALIRGRRTIYERTLASTQLRAAPIVARGTAGLQLSLSF
jgi:hypothetical protein